MGRCSNPQSLPVKRKSRKSLTKSDLSHNAHAGFKVCFASAHAQGILESLSLADWYDCVIRIVDEFSGGRVGGKAQAFVKQLLSKRIKTIPKIVVDGGILLEAPQSYRNRYLPDEGDSVG